MSQCGHMNNRHVQIAGQLLCCKTDSDIVPRSLPIRLVISFLIGSDYENISGIYLMPDPSLFKITAPTDNIVQQPMCSGCRTITVTRSTILLPKLNRIDSWIMCVDNNFRSIGKVYENYIYGCGKHSICPECYWRLHVCRISAGERIRPL